MIRRRGVAYFSTALVTLCMLSMQRASSERSFEEVYKSVKPSVVYVVAALPDGAASGSGFVYDSGPSSSLIVTANHVVEGAQQVDVILDSNVQQRYTAQVLIHDHLADVAVLKIAIGHRKALVMEDLSKVSEGMEIAVSGYPRAAKDFRDILGDDLRPSVHKGIVSAIRLGGKIIQIDAATDHGDSGGPVFDVRNGFVVGIVKGDIALTNAALGVEQPLPGSSYATSSEVISSVLSGTAQSTEGSETTRGTTAASNELSGNATASNSTSAYRIGYLTPQYTSPEVQNVLAPIFDHLISGLQADNSFYLVQQKASSYALNSSAQLFGNCQDERVNALMGPFLTYNLTGGQYSNAFGTSYHGKAEVTVDLTIIDCAAEPFYVAQKSKSENRYFANRAADREVPDMANDLVDKILSDFNAFRSTHAAQWDSLLKTGLAVDPSDTTYHYLFYMMKQKNGNWQVAAVMPGGPADRAGLKKQERGAEHQRYSHPRERLRFL